MNLGNVYPNANPGAALTPAARFAAKVKREAANLSTMHSESYIKRAVKAPDLDADGKTIPETGHDWRTARQASKFRNGYGRAFAVTLP